MTTGDLATFPARADVEHDETSRRQRLAARLGRLPSSTAPLLIIVGVVMLANLVYLSGLTDSDPLSWTTGIARSTCGFICGRSSTDINVGIITQPLGHLSATDLVHGHLPWWNPFEGLGQPLAGEMQSAALFPLVVLLALPGGLIWLHVVLEVVAGASTYFLTRRLGVNPMFGVVGGALFALNGTFAWLANSVVNPVAFLPMLLLGVEIVIAHASDAARRCWYVLAVATALSLYAGFPEVAYLDGLFCVVWVFVRLGAVPRVRRWCALRRVGLGAALGVGLALPALTAFGDFLRVSYVGGHVTAVDGTWSLSLKTLPMLFDPYVYGTLYANAHLFTTWGEVGGYFGTGVCALALVGLFGSRLRALRVALAAWIVAALVGAFNVLGARALWNVLPLLNTASVPRYIMPSCEMALVVLATLGLHDVAAHVAARRHLARAVGVMAVVLLSGAIAAHELDYRSVIDTPTRVVLICAGVIPFAALAVLYVASRLTAFSSLAVVASVVLVAESLAWFMVPTISAPRHVTVDTAPIQFLLTHQGEERFLDLAVLGPNWGSEFGLNALNATDLPFPESFRNYIQRQLYPGLKPQNAFTRDRESGIAHQETELAQHLNAYEDASVKYLLAPRSLALLPALTALGVEPVWHDSLATIYALPHPRPYFTSTCVVHGLNYDAANVTCPGSNATLVRTELSMPGWRATVNGTPVAIHTVEGVFQEIDLPPGTSHVRFAYLPPHEDLAFVASALALLLLVGTSLVERRRRHVASVATTESGDNIDATAPR